MSDRYEIRSDGCYVGWIEPALDKELFLNKEHEQLWRAWRSCNVEPLRVRRSRAKDIWPVFVRLKRVKPPQKVKSGRFKFKPSKASLGLRRFLTAVGAPLDFDEMKTRIEFHWGPVIMRPIN